MPSLPPSSRRCIEAAYSYSVSSVLIKLFSPHFFLSYYRSISTSFLPNREQLHITLDPPLKRIAGLVPLTRSPSLSPQYSLLGSLSPPNHVSVKSPIGPLPVSRGLVPSDACSSLPLLHLLPIPCLQPLLPFHLPSLHPSLIWSRVQA